MNSVGQLEGQSFCQDPHCVDVLVFPPQLKADLYRTKLLSDNKLIIQVLLQDCLGDGTYSLYSALHVTRIGCHFRHTPGLRSKPTIEQNNERNILYASLHP